MRCSCILRLVVVFSIFHLVSSIPALVASQQPLISRDLESRLLDLRTSLDNRIAKYGMDMIPHLEALETTLTSNTGSLNILNSDLSLIKLSLSTATEMSSVNSMSILLEMVSDKLLRSVIISGKVEEKLQSIQTHTQAMSTEIDHMKIFMLDTSSKLAVVRNQIELAIKREFMYGEQSGIVTGNKVVGKLNGFFDRVRTALGKTRVYGVTLVSRCMKKERFRRIVLHRIRDTWA